jgi:hypothetical protein
MDLAQQIRDFYLAHLGELPAEKQFHFASRLAAWTGDGAALQVLRDCRQWMVPEQTHTAGLTAALKKLIATPFEHDTQLTAFALRKPYLAKYAPLYGLELAIFRLRHWETIYGIDGREALFDAISLRELDGIADRLQADDGAMRTLSTIAINYLYLLRRVVQQREDGIDLSHLYALGDNYDTADPQQLRLLFYLYTHCIICETKFYERPLPESTLPVYKQMLARLGTLATEHYDNLSLDTKVEFLACCRMCGIETPLQERIYRECAGSLSPDGMFIVDTYNSFAGHPARQTFAASEHRNVLFVLSGLVYRPHPVRV